MTTDAPVLITGLSGFIARQTALDLLGQGRRVRGTVRSLDQGDTLRSLLERHGADVSRLTLVAADLRSDDGWLAAVDGCRQVLHMASPYPLSQPRDRQALVPEARDGTLRVIHAAQATGVQRVVITSSLAAVMAGQPVPDGRVFTESDWSDTESLMISPYGISKTLAERAAWDAVRDAGPELVSINPGFTVGPTLDGHGGSSCDILALMLSGRYPGVPAIHLPTVDVRDVAAAHIAALQVPAAAGRRILLAERTLSMIEMARLMRDQLDPSEHRLPWLEMPDWLVRWLAFFDRNVATALPELGKVYRVDTHTARELLGLNLRDAGEAVLAAARSLLEHGRV